MRLTTRQLEILAVLRRARVDHATRHACRRLDVARSCRLAAGQTLEAMRKLERQGLVDLAWSDVDADYRVDLTELGAQHADADRKPPAPKFGEQTDLLRDP